MARAALLLSGEVGFSAMTVDQLLARSGSNRERFYGIYRDKAHCYAVGYRAAIEELCGRLLESCERAESWSTGMRAGLLELDAFLTAEPALARGLIAEAPLAEQAVATKRRQVFERLTEAVDRARRERRGSGEEPPEITAEFVVAGIDAEVVRTLHKGIAFADLVPDLLYLSLLFYFGAAAARAEVRRLG
jgi:AcrR family transcriptional regulator